MTALRILRASKSFNTERVVTPFGFNPEMSSIGVSPGMDFQTAISQPKACDPSRPAVRGRSSRAYPGWFAVLAPELPRRKCRERSPEFAGPVSQLGAGESCE